MTKPGSIVIRPTREDAEKSTDAFYTLLDAVRGRVDLSLARIAGITGDGSESAEQNISKRIKDRRFNDEARSVILRHIFDTANLVSGSARREAAKINDALFFALLNFFGANDTSQDKARARVQGTYKFWRFSAEHEDEFLFGKMVFGEDEKTRALKATLVQDKKAHQGEMRLRESFTGYLFRLSHMYFILFRNEQTDDLRVTLLPRFKFGVVGKGVNPNSVYAGQHLHAIHMDGFGLGIDGAAGFFSPVHLSLVDDASELDALDEQLDVVREGDPRLPDRVVRMLRSNGPLRRL